MPSTITAFYDFTPATKARSSEVNTNFSNFRGTFLPIEENTAASSHNSHALGASDHRWTTVYTGTLDLRGMTSTTNLVLRNNTALTAGSAEFLLGSQTLGNWGLGELGFAGLTTTQYTKLQYQAGANGVLDLLSGANTLASFGGTSGIPRKNIAPREYTTTSAPVGRALLLGETSVSMNVQTTGSVTICSARINAKGGGIVRFGFLNNRVYGYNLSVVDATCKVQFSLKGYRGTTTTAMTLLASAVFKASAFGSGVSASSMSVGGWSFGLFVDESYTAGELVYEMRIVGGTSGSSPGSVGRVSGRLFVEEL